jgi:hypothetical protein
MARRALDCPGRQPTPRRPVAEDPAFAVIPGNSVRARTVGRRLVLQQSGGTLITATGTDDRVAGLVYISALAPDESETSQSLQDQFAPTDVFKYIEVADGRIWLQPEGTKEFAGDLPEAEQQLVWATQAVPDVGLSPCCPTPTSSMTSSGPPRAPSELPFLYGTDCGLTGRRRSRDPWFRTASPARRGAAQEAARPRALGFARRRETGVRA